MGKEGFTFSHVLHGHNPLHLMSVSPLAQDPRQGQRRLKNNRKAAGESHT